MYGYEEFEEDFGDEEGEAALAELEGADHGQPMPAAKRAKPSHAPATIDLTGDDGPPPAAAVPPAAAPPPAAAVPVPPVGRAAPQNPYQGALAHQIDYEEENEMRRLDGLPPIVPPPAPDDEPPALLCKCGAGACSVLTSRSANNPNRKFYKCNCGFFQWCDEAPRAAGGGGSANSPAKSPGGSGGGDDEPVVQCQCGAGPCVVLVSRSAKNPNRCARPAPPLRARAPSSRLAPPAPALTPPCWSRAASSTVARTARAGATSSSGSTSRRALPRGSMARAAVGSRRWAGWETSEAEEVEAATAEAAEAEAATATNAGSRVTGQETARKLAAAEAEEATAAAADAA